MARRKAGLPEGFDLGITKPDEKPIRSGDYLDEIDPRPAGLSLTPNAEPDAPSNPSETPKRKPRGEAKPPPTSIARTPSPNGVAKAENSSPARTRLNVSTEGQRRLDAIWERMKEYGPEPTLRKSEIIEAMILATYDARDQLDLSNVRRRGKYGSATHKNFPIALAESIKGALSET